MSPTSFFAFSLKPSPTSIKPPTPKSPPQNPPPMQTNRKLNVKIMVPSDFFSSLPTRPKRKAYLYENLTAEQKAKVAVINAFANSPQEFLEKYVVKAVVGYGGNGCVVAAEEKTEHKSFPVAIKIIYKVHVGKNQKFPTEVTALRELNAVCTSSSVLRCLAAFQDSHHWYLVTELFGSDWLSHVPSVRRDNLTFTSNTSGSIQKHSLPFSQGNVDAWGWQVAHRRYMLQTAGTQLLPTEPIKHIIRECAKALLSIHDVGYFHGDVKLENILLEYPNLSFGNKSDSPLLMLADYGYCAKVSDGIQRYGTEEIAPPEFLGDGPGFLDGRASDVYALGMVLFVLMSEFGMFPSAVKSAKEIGYRGLLRMDGGKFPFDFSDTYSEGARDLLNGMCMVNPEKRLDMRAVLSQAWLCSNDV
ncbi:UNVERIFIED_CONTAM: hypothetical protein HDU68_001025 [Siphonaria sp. JEL0065]|nr:hypothetical protein HDU68_001025 [Siphonaria sp. JEL0065]